MFFLKKKSFQNYSFDGSVQNPVESLSTPPQFITVNNIAPQRKVTHFYLYKFA